MALLALGRLEHKYADPPDERPYHPDPPDEQKINSFLDKIIRTPGQNHPDPRVKTKKKGEVTKKIKNNKKQNNKKERDTKQKKQKKRRVFFYGLKRRRRS